MLLTDLGIPVREWRSSGAGVPEPGQIRRAGLPEQPEGEDEEAQAHHTQHNHTRNQCTGDRIQRLGRAAHELWVVGWRFVTPGDYGAGGYDGVPWGRTWHCMLSLTVSPPAFSTDRHKYCTVICPTQLCDTMQKHSGHLLVLMFHKTKDFKRKTTHLTFPVLKNSGLWILVAPIKPPSQKKGFKKADEVIMFSYSEIDTQSRTHIHAHKWFPLKGLCALYGSQLVEQVMRTHRVNAT